MKGILKVLIVATVLTGVGFFVVREINKRRKLKIVADSGYETAQDILFPGKGIKSKKVHYGPVLPANS